MTEPFGLEYCVAKLWLIFAFQDKPDESPEECYTYVHWFGPIQQSSGPLKLNKVQKLYWNKMVQASRIVLLNNVKFRCGLLPVIYNQCDGLLGQYTAIDAADKFYINHYALLDNFCLWWDK